MINLQKTVDFSNVFGVKTLCEREPCNRKQFRN